MTDHCTELQRILSKGPSPARELMAQLRVSQPTLSRTLQRMGEAVVRFGPLRATQYALRDEFRGLRECSVYRVSEAGRLHRLGTLLPVRPEGFVMRRDDGRSDYTEGLPWWLLEMRPQGFLGRAYAQQHGPMLGLSPHVQEWTDAQALRALLTHSTDAVGNLLLGDTAREQFIHAPPPQAIATPDKGARYARLAAAAGTLGNTWSSAGGEQPKFCTYADTAAGPRHVLVKFTVAHHNPITERWRDLLLAEHLALQTLHQAGLAAAQSCLIDHEGQRFLEVQRFDRSGERGRRALLSLEALSAEFIGDLRSPWPVVTMALAEKRAPKPIITAQAAETAALLYAFGQLIGNDDMHQGNLSFTTEEDQGRPYQLAPAYDMLPMAFRPPTSGDLRHTLAPVVLHPSVRHATWQHALQLARTYLDLLQTTACWSADFIPCLYALDQHIADAEAKIARLG